MWAWPGKKLLFMGCEFGQSREWAYAGSLDWHLLQYLDHEGIRLLVRDLNRLYKSEPVLGANDLDGRNFRWINCTDADATVLSYLRHDQHQKTFIVVAGNYTPVQRTHYRVGVPRAGWWRELINTDSEYYGGGGAGNGGGAMAENVPWDGFDFSVRLTLPAISTVLLKWSEAEA
jgi:1,4-alpha-glucan branching enzyme